MDRIGNKEDTLIILRDSRDVSEPWVFFQSCQNNPSLLYRYITRNVLYQTHPGRDKAWRLQRSGFHNPFEYEFPLDVYEFDEDPSDPEKN